jgi:hypothetical protein
VTVLGGGTEAVSEEEARALWNAQTKIAIDDAGGLQGLLADIRFDTLLGIQFFSVISPFWYPVLGHRAGAGLRLAQDVAGAVPLARRTVIDKPEWS